MRLCERKREREREREKLFYKHREFRVCSVCVCVCFGSVLFGLTMPDAIAVLSAPAVKQTVLGLNHPRMQLVDVAFANVDEVEAFSQALGVNRSLAILYMSKNGLSETFCWPHCKRAANQYGSPLVYI
jgi:hypothetical protein